MPECPTSLGVLLIGKLLLQLIMLRNHTQGFFNIFLRNRLVCDLNESNHKPNQVDEITVNAEKTTPCKKARNHFGNDR